MFNCTLCIASSIVNVLLISNIYRPALVSAQYHIFFLSFKSLWTYPFVLAVWFDYEVMQWMKCKWTQETAEMPKGMTELHVNYSLEYVGLLLKALLCIWSVSLHLTYNLRQFLKSHRNLVIVKLCGSQLHSLWGP